jgi:hypothetical protein
MLSIQKKNQQKRKKEGIERFFNRYYRKKSIQKIYFFFSNTQRTVRESLDVTDDSDIHRCLLPPCININNVRGGLLVFLSYVEPGFQARRSGCKKLPLIEELTRISKASNRVYWRASTGLPRVQGGLGLAVLSTTEGIITDAEARAKGVGGEVLFTATKRKQF